MNCQTTLHLHEEKKHSVRYDAKKGDEDAAVTSIYVMKTALSKPYPKTILVTIEAQE